MRLERIFRHRVIRVLRVALPLVVLVLVAVPAWNYYLRRTQNNDSVRSGVQLPSGVSVRTEGFRYNSTEGGRTRFTVAAKQSLAFQDEKYILQDVDVTVFGATDQEPPRTLHSKECTYDKATNDFNCRGNVEVHLDRNTIVRTENLIYRHQDGSVIGPERATIEQKGSVGRANSFEYSMPAGLLKLAGNVWLQTADHTEVESAVALVQQKENWASMSGGVFIKSPNTWIRGSSGRADLEPESHKPKTITVEGDVTAESQSRVRDQSWKMRAGWMETAMSPDGNAERVKARRNVEIEKIVGDSHQRLSGGEVDAEMKDGKVEMLDARENARMDMGDGQTLESSHISTNGVGTVRTGDVSVLRFGDSTIEGREFVIESEEELVMFNTARRAVLKNKDQQSSSDQTRALFDGRSSTLLELVQTGNFQFRTPQYEGRAQTGRFAEGGSVITLEGSPVVNDSEMRLEAAQIRLNQKENSFLATKNVMTLIKNSDAQVLVKASRAEGGGDAVLYTGNVQLWRGDAHIRSERLNATGKGDNARLHAEALPGGRVQSYIQNIRATSDSLDYDQSRGEIRYQGRVRAQKQDMILETPDMTVNFRDQEVKEIVASGGVQVTRGDERGSGERAVYDSATDVVTLTGKNAQVRDGQQRLVQGPKLIVKTKGETASVESEKGERTVSKHPVKNERK